MAACKDKDGYGQQPHGKSCPALNGGKSCPALNGGKNACIIKTILTLCNSPAEYASSLSTYTEVRLTKNNDEIIVNDLKT